MSLSDFNASSALFIQAFLKRCASGNSWLLRASKDGSIPHQIFVGHLVCCFHLKLPQASIRKLRFVFIDVALSCDRNLFAESKRPRMGKGRRNLSCYFGVNKKKSFFYLCSYCDTHGGTSWITWCHRILQCDWCTSMHVARNYGPFNIWSCPVILSKA